MKKPDAELNKTVIDNLKLMGEKVVQVQGNQVFIGSELMTAQEIMGIVAECKMLKETKLWGIFQETIRYNAIKRIVEATTVDEVRPGKWMIAVLNDLNLFIHNFTTVGKAIQPLKKPEVSNNGR